MLPKNSKLKTVALLFYTLFVPWTYSQRSPLIQIVVCRPLLVPALGTHLFLKFPKFPSPLEKLNRHMNDDLEWQSIRYRDGTTYEGLAKDGRNHERGVLVHPNGDRYEGEFRENQYWGFGAYVWTSKGAIYRGQFKEGRIKGCGVRAFRQPDGSFAEEAGFFVDDEFVGPILACPVTIAQAMAAEADIAASMSRAFQLKPPGTKGPPLGWISGIFGARRWGAGGADNCKSSEGTGPGSLVLARTRPTLGRVGDTGPEL